MVVAIALAATAAGDLTAQQTNPPAASRNRRVWTGTIDDREILLNATDTTPIRRPVRYYQDVNVTFRFVSESDPDRPGFTRWVSRQLSWNGFGVSSSSIAGRECIGSGSLDLGPADALDATTPDQDAELEIPCKDWDAPNVWSFIPVPNPKVRMPVIDMSMTNCEPPRRWSAGGVRYTLSVAGDSQVDAVVELDHETYAGYVPEPGQPLTLTVRSTSGPVRFRFQLDPANTSSFPGYATNANIDDVFFAKYNLGSLQGQYANDGRDWIFNPEHFGASGWSRRDLGIVETRTAETSAIVPVTAMDFGAVGRLRILVESSDCGGSWQPATIRVNGQQREWLTLPLDEDGNLIADALTRFRGIDSGTDDDAEPAGNGMAGDGLTAFEEYRGFLIRGVGCGSEATEAIYSGIVLSNQPQVTGWSDRHMRTAPDRKDLFVHTPDPELALLLPAFSAATDLAVHAICESHYVDNDTRTVNFTLHRGNTRAWQGRSIARDRPQHGIRLEPVDHLGLRGLALPVNEGDMGPPGLTRTVQVVKPGPASSFNARRGRLELPELVHTIVHELGHAVGIPHHGDSVDATRWRVIIGRQNVTKSLSLQQHAGGPPDSSQQTSLPEMADAYYAAVGGRQYLNSLLVEPGPDCEEGAPNATFFINGKFAGCSADSIARRGQQNSGDFECPMRYSGADYYEAPGSVAQYRWTALVQERIFGSLRFGALVDAWGGRLLRYRNDLDRDGTGRFCVRTNGTEINSLPGDMNHAGDAGRDKPCIEFLVVNDLAAAGTP
jgi:hypothetical protein